MSDYTDGDVIFDTQWLAMKRALEGNGIVSGLQGAPGPGALQTSWNSGTFFANITKKVMGSPSLFTHSAGHATNDRWDLIYGDASGLTKVEGSPAAAPQMPNLPANSIIIGLVYIPATTATITAGMIRDFGFTTPLQDHIQGSTHPYIPIAESDITFSGAGHGHSGGADGKQLSYLDLVSRTHALGGGDHSASTLAALNALISGATLDDISGSRTPVIHGPSLHSDRDIDYYVDLFGVAQPSGASNYGVPVTEVIGTCPVAQQAVKFADGFNYAYVFSAKQRFPKGWSALKDLDILFTGIDASGNVFIQEREIWIWDLTNTPTRISRGTSTIPMFTLTADGAMGSNQLFPQSDFPAVPSTALFFQINIKIYRSNPATDTYPHAFYHLGYKWQMTVDQ